MTTPPAVAIFDLLRGLTAAMNYVLILDKPRGECHVAHLTDEQLRQVDGDYEVHATFARGHA